MMTAMIKSSNSHSDSDDSDSPNSPLAKNQTLSSSPNSRPPKYHTQIKTKFPNLQIKTQDLHLILLQSNPFLLLSSALIPMIIHNPFDIPDIYILLDFISFPQPPICLDL